MANCHIHRFVRASALAACLALTGSLVVPLCALGAEPGMANGDIFSTPDAAKAPDFIGRSHPVQFTDPLFGPNGDPPGRDAIRAIPSITGTQLKQLDDIINQTRDSTQPLQEEVASLHRIQDQRKQSKFPAVVTPPSIPALAPDVLHRDSGMMMDAAPFQGPDSAFADDSDESIKSRIQALNEQMNAIRSRQWPSIRAMLTGQQLDQLQKMRNGQLYIANNAPTNIPEPPPDQKPNTKPVNHPGHAPTGPPINRQYYPSSRPFAYPAKQPSIVQPLLQTTKQILYRNLWRLY